MCNLGAPEPNLVQREDCGVRNHGDLRQNCRITELLNPSERASLRSAGISRQLYAGDLGDTSGASHNRLANQKLTMASLSLMLE